MANSGIKGSQAGTALRSMMNALAGEVKFCGASFGEIEIATTNADGSMRALNDILADCCVAFAQMSESEQASAAQALVGKNAMSGFLALMNAAPGDIQKLEGAISTCSDEIDGYNGVTAKMAAVMQDNLGGQLTILKSQLQELAISFGEILMPAIRAIVTKIQGFIDKLNAMDPATKETIVKIALVAAALGPLLVVVGKTMVTVGKLMKFVSNLPTIIAGAKAAFTSFGGVIGGISAPVVAVIAVVAALVAAFVHLWRTNEDFRNKITAIWNQIKSIFAGFCQGIVDRVNALGFDFKNIGEVIKAVWDGLCKFLAPVFEGVFQQVANIFKAVTDIILNILDIFVGIFTGDWDRVWNGIKGIFIAVWNYLKDMLKNCLNVLCNLFGTNLNEVKEFWVNVWTSIKNFFVNIWNGIKNFFVSVWTGIKNVFVGIWTAIYNDVTTKINLIKTVITVVWNAIHTAISTVLNAIWSVISSIWNSIKEHITNTLNAIHAVVSAVWNAISGFVSGVLNTISSVVSSVWNGIKNTVSAVMNAIKTTVSNIWGSVKNAVTQKITAIKDTIVGGFNVAVNFIKDLGSQAFSWGADIIDGIVNGIKSMIGNLADCVTGVADTIREFLHFSVPDKGPLTDYESWMPDFMRGLADGINKSKKYVEAAVSGVADAMKLTMQSDLSYQLDGVSAAVVGSTGGASVVNNYYNNDNSRTVNQTNNSPKSLSQLEIYRLTRNALNT